PRHPPRATRRSAKRTAFRLRRPSRAQILAPTPRQVRPPNPPPLRRLDAPPFPPRSPVGQPYCQPVLRVAPASLPCRVSPLDACPKLGTCVLRTENTNPTRLPST